MCNKAGICPLLLIRCSVLQTNVKPTTTVTYSAFTYASVEATRTSAKNVLGDIAMCGIVPNIVPNPALGPRPEKAV